MPTTKARVLGSEIGSRHCPLLFLLRADFSNRTLFIFISPAVEPVVVLLVFIVITKGYSMTHTNFRKTLKKQ